MARRKRDGNQDDQHGTVPVDFNAAPRAAQALRLRRLGYTYQRIADQLGYANESGARKVIKAARSRIIADEARALVVDQLDYLQEALMVVLPRIARDDQASLWAVDRLTPLLKRQAELMGLDAKNDPVVSGQVLVREYPHEWIEGVKG